MTAPSSTYRVQLQPLLKLAGAAEVVPYLADLGAGALYSSPLLHSAHGSQHGYDVVAHDQVDTELGGRAALDVLAERLRAHGLGLVLDVVPNHVSVASPVSDGSWWWDVLKHGRESKHAKAFDIDWARHDGRILLAVLDEPLAEVLARGGIARDGETLRYGDHVWPLAPGTPDDPDVGATLVRQHYLPDDWRRGACELNYRRFFDVSALAGLRVEDPDVFAASHAIVLSLVRAGVVTGLRVDHPDGLADPTGYLGRLAEESGGVWTVAEKVLQPSERLPDWPVAGTVGYDALSDITALFTDPDGREPMTRLYGDFTGEPTDWLAVATEAKREVLHTALCAEVEWLHRLVPHEPREAVVELLVAFDRYRAETPAEMAHAVARVPEQWRAAAGRLVDLVVSGRHPAFATRLKQASGPAMAKGVEDTAFYRYHRLVSLNEVGCSPDLFGMSVERFHECADNRPCGAMTTLSTHDTKRGEDVRARISVLAQVPDEWGDAVRRWSAITGKYGDVGRNFEYLMYQTFVGAHPLDPDRAVAYALKAAREAKRETSWLAPDETYERAVETWVRGCLADDEFTADLAAFVAPVTVHGWVVSLAQKLVQLTIPGVPDVYQGTELWGDSLVDPDNRRPVDFAQRARLLADVDALDLDGIGARAAEGLPKLLVTSRALRLRQARPDAFDGSYDPLDVAGAWADRVVAFGRGGEVVTVVPRLTVHVAEWKDTTVALPPGHWRNVLTGETVGSGAVADLLGRFPVALLERR